MKNIPKKYHSAVRKLIKKAREEERAIIIKITENVRDECRESDDQWTKGV